MIDPSTSSLSRGTDLAPNTRWRAPAALRSSLTTVGGHAGAALHAIGRRLRSLTGAPGTSSSEEAARLRREVIRHFASGDLPGATDAAHRLLVLQKAELGEDHPDYATGLSDLALLLAQQGDEAGAADLLGTVVAIRRAALGPDHADTAEASARLDALRVSPRPGRPAVADPIGSGRGAEPAAEAGPIASTPPPEPVHSPGSGPDGPPFMAVADLGHPILDGVLRLRPTSGISHDLLADCHATARRLRDSVGLGHSNEEVMLLLTGNHPFVALLELVEAPESLGTAEWANSYDLVRAAFGSEVARAAARGKVRREPSGTATDPV